MSHKESPLSDSETKELYGGPLRIWRTPDRICWAENDFLRMAYVIDPAKAGTEGWFGPNQIWVQYITIEEGLGWQDAPTEAAAP